MGCSIEAAKLQSAEIINTEEDEKFPHDCAAAGAYAPGRAANIVRAALIAMNLRGQEGAGMVSYNDKNVPLSHKGKGWVVEVLTDKKMSEFNTHNGYLAIGQGRYSTAGKKKSFQPFVGKESLAHNGNLTNVPHLRELLNLSKKKKVPSDTWLLFQLIEQSNQQGMEKKIIEAISECEGAYSLILAGEGKLFGVRDPHGFRPLSIGFLPPKDDKPAGYILASETCAFTEAKAEYVRDVEPGEGVVIDENGIHTFYIDPRLRSAHLARCIFEFVYIAAPDSYLFDEMFVSEFRRQCGRLLARRDIEEGFLPDVIVPVQHSGITGAEGYAEEYVAEMFINYERFGLTHEEAAKKIGTLQTKTGMVVNPYRRTGRTFISPENRGELNGFKHRADWSVLNGKKAVFIDDSVVRGDAVEKLQIKSKAAGAEEFHLRSCSPPVRHPCFMGVDTPDPSKLFANIVGEPVEENGARHVNADSIHYLSLSDMLFAATGERVAEQNAVEFFHKAGYCGACFHGDYPVNITGIVPKEPYKTH